MPAVHSGDSRHDVTGSVPEAGSYLTNEVFLYRIVSAVDEGMVELEDCYLLDVVRVPANALRARGLRPVRLAAFAASTV